MAITLTSCSILSALLLCVTAVPLVTDDPVEQVKTVVAHLDDYLATHGMHELFLPDIGHFSFEPVKLRNGGFGDFSTIYVQDVSSINETKLEDGTLYSFDIHLGLNQLEVHYDFNISSFIIHEDGNLKLSMLKNSARLSGTVAVRNNKTCEAKINNVRVLEAGDYRLDLSVDSSATILVSELLLNIITPKLVPLLNAALKAVLLVPGAQNIFSAIVCSHLY